MIIRKLNEMKYRPQHVMRSYTHMCLLDIHILEMKFTEGLIKEKCHYMQWLALCAATCPFLAIQHLV